MDRKIGTGYALSAVWRDLTESQIKALPISARLAKASGNKYYYPNKKCGDHMAIMQATAFRCVVCREEKRIKAKAAKEAKKNLPKKTAKVISVFGITRTIYS